MSSKQPMLTAIIIIITKMGNLVKYKMQKFTGP